METVLIAARFVQFAAGAVLCGLPLFFLYGPPPPDRAWPKRLMTAAGALGLAAVIVWLMAQSALFGDGAKDAIDPLKVWTVASGTELGKAALLRAALFLCALAASKLIGLERSTWLIPAGLGLVVAASLAWLGHGGYGDGVAAKLHRLFDVVHLIAASVWTGALAALAVLAASAARADAGPAEARLLRIGLERFSGIGLAVVGAVIASGLVNGWFLVGPARVGDLPGSPYGLALIVKLVLFVLMLVLAAAHRYVLTPRLAQGGGARSLRTSVILETALAVLVLVAVAYMGVQSPPASA